MNLRILGGAVVLLLSQVTAAQAALTPSQAAGRVLYVVGQVEIEQSGARSIATRGQMVAPGSTVHTGTNGYTQVRLADGGLVWLKPQSSFAIAEIVPPVYSRPLTTGEGERSTDAQLTTPGRATMRLLRGGFRALSGLIGKNRADSYSIHTPVATIGIRGTNQGASMNAEGGVDNMTYSGQTTLTNSGGTTSYTAGQHGATTSSNSPSTQTTTPPASMTNTSPTPSQQAMSGTNTSGGSSSSTGDTSSGSGGSSSDSNSGGGSGGDGGGTTGNSGSDSNAPSSGSTAPPPAPPASTQSSNPVSSGLSAGGTFGNTQPPPQPSSSAQTQAPATDAPQTPPRGGFTGSPN